MIIDYGFDVQDFVAQGQVSAGQFIHYDLRVQGNDSKICMQNHNAVYDMIIY